MSLTIGTPSMRETPQEGESRAVGNFTDFEKTLPNLPSRWVECSLADNLSSYLGPYNPFSHPVDPAKHLVWLFDNTAYTHNGSWEAEFIAAYFIKNSGKDLSKIVADIAEKLGLGKGDEAEKTIAERLGPWFDTIQPARTVQIGMGGGNGEITRLGPGGRDGISSQVVHISAKHSEGETMTSHAVNIDAVPMNTVFAGSEGWAVISDVDDTIKITQTSSPTGILKTTFVDEPQAVKGMPELYSHINERLSRPPFFYLSASPYNLYPFLRSFRDAHYPQGTLILRDNSWMNLAGFLASLTIGTQNYKVDRMNKIHGWLPNRKFICIGDSTQTDPESYAEIYKTHPGWIKGIFIRKVPGLPELEITGKNRDERFTKAFESVPKDVWHVFEDPKELYEKVDKLIGGET